MIELLVAWFVLSVPTTWMLCQMFKRMDEK